MTTPSPDPLAPLIEAWLSSADPAAALERLCREHPDLADDLRAHTEVFDRPTATREVANEHAAALDSAATPPQIGPYRLLRILGEGGMGTVYLAEQREPVQRRVALKLIKLGMDSLAIVQRFQQEQQALAVMDHEGIAKVFDCGTSERGQPYFVMELVKGVPLDSYCAQTRLSLYGRLHLMQQVCAAVQHAHQKGVLHRDLKPGNVLVGDVDGKLQVKIIDFGLAKAIGGKLIQESLVSELGVVIGTPEYMAPEQANPSNLDIDTRADVYSLGVMIYELLVGELPFNDEQLRAGGWAEMQRVLREVEPLKPSTKLSRPAKQSTVQAKQLRISASTLRRALKGDLDWVVLKALEKDRNRRYGSANALAEDLQRFLDHEPLVAGPPSAVYRLQKLLRRHRGAVTVAALLLVTMVSGGVATYMQWQRAEQQASENLKLAQDNDKIAKAKTALAESESDARQAAVAALAERDEALKKEQQALADEKERAAELEAVAQFQQEQFSDVDPDLMGIRLREALAELLAVRYAARGLDEAATKAGLAEHAQRMQGVDFTGLALRSLAENFFEPGLKVLDVRFDDQPLLQARLRQTVASVLLGLGRLELATKPQQQALEARRSLLGSDHLSTLVSIDNMGVLLRSQGKLVDAEPFCREALERRRRVLDGDHPATLASISNMSSLLESQGKLVDAEPFCREALEGRRRVLGGDHPATLESISSMGILLRSQGKLVEAEPFFREALEGNRRVLGDDHPSTLASINNMGALLHDQDKFVEAEPLYREALKGRRRVLGDDHPYTLATINNMCTLLYSQGKLADAEPLFRVALEGSRRVLGDDHPNTLTLISNMGMLLWSQGKHVEVEPFYRESLEGLRRVLGDDHPQTLTLIGNMGILLRSQGKLVDAEPFYRESLEGRRRVLGDDHVATLASINNMGDLLRSQGKLVEAEPFYREALEISRRVLGDDRQETLIYVKDLYICLVRSDRYDEARAALAEFLAMTKLSSDHANVLAVKALLKDLDKK